MYEDNEMVYVEISDEISWKNNNMYYISQIFLSSLIPKNNNMYRLIWDQFSSKY